MNHDWTAGLSPEVDYPQLDQGADLSVGENHAFWIFDDAARFAVLNCHIQGGDYRGFGHMSRTQYELFPDWSHRRVAFAMGIADGRVLVDFFIGTGAEVDGFRVGGWTVRCVEPFRRWTVSYEGSPVATTVGVTSTRMIGLDEPRVPVTLRAELEMIHPPWIQGVFAEDTPRRAEGLLFVGAPRYEQLYRSSGRISIGTEDFEFSGSGLRTHRYGRRSGTTCSEHVWATATFPSGRAFGCVTFRADDYETVLAEAWVDGGDGMSGARLTETPWPTGLTEKGERVALQLTSSDRTAIIDAEIAAVAYNFGAGVDDRPGSRVISHCMARFTWDGETTCGLLERSTVVAAAGPP